MTTVAVTAATGAQGAAIASACEAAGLQVRRLSRRAGPAIAGATLHVADPAEPDSLAAALEGVDALVLTSPVDHRRGAREALAAAWANAAAAAGLRRVVLNTAAAVPDALDAPTARTLRAVRQVMLEGAVPAVVLQPTVYLDNLATPWAAPALVGEGVLNYPASPAAPIAWISHATLGAFCAAAVTAAGVEGAVLDIGGPENLTGPALAAVLAVALGRPVEYRRTPNESFAAALDAAFGAPAGQDIAAYYEHLEAHPSDFARDGSAAARLGVIPESAAAWAARQAWPQG